MNAVWMRARAELRRRSGAALLLIIVLGLFAGTAGAAVAGGRRTASAHARFLDRQDSFDVFVGDFSVFIKLFWKPDYRWMGELPYVERLARSTHFFSADEDTEITAHADAAFGTAFAKDRIIEGRAADPASPEEAVVPFASDIRKKVRVGERLTLKMHGVDETPVEVSLRIVGVVAGPGHFPPLDLLGNDVIATPAFAKKYAPRSSNTRRGSRQAIFSTTSAYVWLRDGFADIDRFKADLDRRSGEKLVQVFDMRLASDNVERSFDLEAIALWFIGGFLGLAVALVFSQALARHVTDHAHENVSLRAVGMRRGDLVAVGVVRAAVVLAGGAAIAVATMVALSPIFPRGLARVAELHTGAAFDAAAFGVAFGSIALLIVLVLVVPLFRATSPRADARMGRSRPSRIAGVFARARMSPAAVSGARLAVESGTGASAVPVRSTIAAAVIAIVAILAAATFGSSMRHMLDSPPLWGKNWHVQYGFEDQEGPAKNLPIARAHPDVEAAETGSTGIPMTVDGVDTYALMLDSGWSVTVPPLEGDYPREGQVMVAPRTLRTLGKRVGDTVRIAPPGVTPRPFEISGIGIVPPMSETMQLGQGLTLGYKDAIKILPFAPPADELTVRFREGVNVPAAIERLRARLIEPSLDFSTQSPNDLINLGRIDTLPVVVTAILGALATAIIAHMLLASVSRRRKDLAILKTIGFERRQLRRTVAWQATLLVAIALAWAIPLGIAGGRLLWEALAERLGVVAQPMVDMRWIYVTVPAALLLANIVAWFPAQNAARTRPTMVLRTE